MTTQTSNFVILGGSGMVGRALIAQFQQAPLQANIVSRRGMKDVPPGFRHVQIDLNGASDWKAAPGAIIISFIPIWKLATCLERFKDAKTIIATSSTSRFSKEHSGDAQERSTATKLADAEDTIISWAKDKGIVWTILRPTLIYNGQNDQNIARMARFIRRWHFLPLAAPATGLRQPVHTQDVAKAAFKSINNPAAANQALNIAGGEILSYRDMATRVFMGLGQKPRFVFLPTHLLQRTFRLAAQLGILKESSFGASIFQRMNEDLIFDIQDGLQALDYHPRPFKPDFGE